MADRLTVARDEIHLGGGDACKPDDGGRGVREDLPHLAVQPAHFLARKVRGAQEPRPERRLEGRLREADGLHARVGTEAGDAHQEGVDSVHRRPAVEARDQAGGLRSRSGEAVHA